MRKFHLLFIFFALLTLSVHGIPADPAPSTVVQSDGTTLTLRLVGDEFFHYCTTDDGYTVVQNNAGSYEYALVSNGQLAPSGLLAHDAGLRGMAERQLLAGVGKHLTASEQIERGRQSRARINGPANREPVIDYSSFRGLIILINYTDRSFSMSDPGDFYDKMINQRGFSSFVFNGRRQYCTGSMRDYFYDQSNGIFDPQFDIVGPIDVDYSCRDHNSTSNSWRIFRDALNAVDGQVDFSQYDNDGDGAVDMVYFLVAGYSANYSGNDGGYLWPHKSYLYDYENRHWLEYDGVSIGVYASSCEIYGWESQGYTMPLGIGTMCHEFSHVLGLPDLYDTDYAQGGGQSHHPEGWDVMAGGGSYNYGRTPCAYSIWERYALGWAQPTEITEPGEYSLEYVGNSNHGYILRSPSDGEFFMLDNRQLSRWDAYLPGHGMLVARVDSTDWTVWDWNTVNANPEHNYYELIRASNSASGDSPADPFPGTYQVDELSFTSTPALKTWSGMPLDFMLTDISEQNGVVRFTIANTPDRFSAIEDFEQMSVAADQYRTNVPGAFATWTFAKSAVLSPGQTLCNGNNAASIVSGSRLEMTSDVECRAYMVDLQLFNPSSTTTKVKLYSSTDGGVTWDECEGSDGEVAARTNAALQWRVNLKGKMRFRINMTSGSKNTKCYVDDFTIHYTGDFKADTSALKGDVNRDGVVDVTDVSLVINYLLGLGGDTLCDVDGNGAVDVADVNEIINIILGN